MKQSIQILQWNFFRDNAKVMVTVLFVQKQQVVVIVVSLQGHLLSKFLAVNHQ